MYQIIQGILIWTHIKSSLHNNVKRVDMLRFQNSLAFLLFIYPGGIGRLNAWVVVV